MLLKHYLEEGVSKAKLSRRLGVNRRTIQRWVGAGQLERDMAEGGAVYSRRPRVRHQPYPYKGIIGTRLAQYPRLSAKRLFDEVQAAGYTGGYWPGEGQCSGSARKRTTTAIYAHLDDAALHGAAAVIARAMGFSAEPPPLPVEALTAPSDPQVRPSVVSHK